MRYNVRIVAEYRDLYCRGCSTFWVEGRTVRTRLRAGRRVRTCLACGRVRRVPVHGKAGPPAASIDSLTAASRDDESLAGPVEDNEDAGNDDDSSG